MPSGFAWRMSASLRASREMKGLMGGMPDSSCELSGRSVISGSEYHRRAVASKPPAARGHSTGPRKAGTDRQSVKD